MISLSLAKLAQPPVSVSEVEHLTLGQSLRHVKKDALPKRSTRCAISLVGVTGLLQEIHA
ncbi:MAG: hypothetical protein ACI84R_000944 [Candidatus Azotimanducaceae bacterium]|jgi:hypothetical protein